MAGLFPDFRVTLEDGQRLDVVTKFSDGRAWEQYAAREGVDATGSPFTMGVFFAWRAARKQGVSVDETLDEFGDRISDLERVVSAAPVPTKPAHGAG